MSQLILTVFRSYPTTLIASVLLAILIWSDIRSDRIEIEPFNVPKSLEESGFEGTVLARMFIDQLNMINNDTRAAAYSQLGFQTESGLTQLDIELPGFKLSPRALISVVRSIFGLRPPKVLGEMTLDANGQSGTLTVRLREDDLPFSFHLNSLTTVLMRQALFEAAKYVYGISRPVAMAYYYLIYERKLDLALQTINRAIRSDRAADVILGFVIWGKWLQEVGEPELAKSKFLDAITFGKKQRSWKNFFRSIPEVSAANAALGLWYFDVDHNFNESEKYLKRATKLAYELYNPFINLGYEYSEIGRLSDARKAFEKALKSSIRKALTIANIGVLEEQTFKFDAAKERYQEALLVDPQFLNARVKLAMSIWNRGGASKVKQIRMLFEEGEAALWTSQSKQSSVDSIRTLRGKGVLQFFLAKAEWMDRIGDQPEAARALEKAEELGKRFAEENAKYPAVDLAAVYRAQAALRHCGDQASDNCDEAIKFYKDAISIHEKDYESRIALAGLLLSLGKSDQGLALLEQAKQVTRLESVVWREYGRHYLNSERLDAAEQNLEKAVKRNPYDWQTYWLLAILNRKQRHTDKAIQFYGIALKMKPLNLALRADFADALQNFGHTEDAFRQGKLLVTIYSESSIAHRDLGVLYENNKQYTDARQEYRLAIKLDPKNAVAYSDLADVTENIDGPEAARDLRRTAASLGLTDDYALLQLGISYMNAGELDRAEEQFRAVIARHPREEEAFFNLALIQQKEKRYEEAQTNFEAALLITRKDNTLNNLGVVLEALGKRNEAKTKYHEACALRNAAACTHLRRLN